MVTDLERPHFSKYLDLPLEKYPGMFHLWYLFLSLMRYQYKLKKSNFTLVDFFKAAYHANPGGEKNEQKSIYYKTHILKVVKCIT